MRNCLRLLICVAILGAITLAILNVYRLFGTDTAESTAVSPKFVGCDTEAFLAEGDGVYIIRLDDLPEENN